MTVFLNSFAQGPLLGAPAMSEQSVWARNFASGRLAGLAVAFVAAPFCLAIPTLGAQSLAVLVAALGVAVLGLIAVNCARSAVTVAVTTAIGFGFLAVGYISGLSAPTIAVAALALLIDVFALPRGQRLGLVVGIGGCVVAGLLLLLPWAPAAGAAQAMLATVLLPIPALLTLGLQMQGLRAAADASTHAAGDAVRRERMISDASAAAIVLVERAGWVVDATPMVKTLFAPESGEVLGRGLGDRVLIADRPMFLKAISDALHGSAQSAVVRMETGAGFASFALDVRAIDPQAEREQVSIRIAPDVSVQAGAISALDRAPLFAALSHEVRTPMNAILGFSELLANPALCPRDQAKVAEYARIIHSSAQSSFAVTRAIVDLLRVESTPFSSPAEPVDAGEILRGMISQAAAREGNGRVSVSMTGDADISGIAADPRAVRMLLSSLVEGLTAAVERPMSIECVASTHGLRPALDITIVAAGPANNVRKNEAFLGVIRILADRLAREVGGELTISPVAQGWHARLLFAVPASTHMLRPKHVPTEPENVVILRKSA